MAAFRFRIPANSAMSILSKSTIMSELHVRWQLQGARMPSIYHVICRIACICFAQAALLVATAGRPAAAADDYLTALLSDKLF